jgi:mannan endo-1,4-beta-mannosidase
MSPSLSDLTIHRGTAARKHACSQACWRLKLVLLLGVVSAISVWSQAQTLLAIRYGNDGWRMGNLAAQEAWQGKRNAAVLLFTNFCNDPNYINNLFGTQLPNIWNSGHVPIISWQPKSCPGNSTPTDIDVRIESGSYDSYLQTWFTRLKQFLAGPDSIYGTADDRRVYIRLAHEMNGNWYPWSATTGGSAGNPGSGNTVADYIGMWQHVHNALGTLGVDSLHVQWIWCPNATDSTYSHPLEDYYPGDAYVDWVGVDGYNFGGNRWITAANRFTTPFSRLHNLAPIKPLSVPETGTVAVTSTGSISIAAKNSWLTAAYGFFASSNVKLVSYFDVNAISGNDYSVFGGPSGDQTFVYNGSTYTGFSGYQQGVAAPSFIAASLSNPRLLTDAQFTGASSSAPVAQLSLTPISGTSPLSVSASASVSNGTVASSTINFGDGTVINSSSATHVYSNPGSYTVTATVTDSYGHYCRATGLITVSQTTSQGKVIAKLSLSPNSGTRPLKVSASTAGSIGTAFSIDFGDGTVVSGPAANHVYSHPGSYTVTATVHGAAGTAKAAAQVLVKDKGPDFQLVSHGTVNPTALGGAGFAVSVIPLNGSYDRPVYLRCANLPAFATCVFSRAVVVPGRVSSSARISLILQRRPSQRLLGMILPFWTLGLAGIAIEFRRWRTTRLVRTLSINALIAFLVLLLACAGTRVGTAPSSTITASSNSFSFSVVGSSGPIEHSIHFVATVGGSSTNPTHIATVVEKGRR